MRWLRIALVATVFTALSSLSFAQFEGAKAEMYAKGKPSPSNFHDFIPEGPALADPANVRAATDENDYNLYFRFVWPTPLAESQRWYSVIVDAEGKMVTSIGHPWVDKGATELTGRFSLKAGTYKLRLASQDDYDKFACERVFTVGSGTAAKKDDVVPPSKIGSSKVWICDDTDDQLKPLHFDGDPAKGVMNWTAEKDFNLLVVNPKPFKVDQLLIVFHHQNDDGTDGKFEYDTRTDTLQDTTNKWASSNGLTREGRGLPAGKYTVYVIDEHKQDVSEKIGNYKESFAKITLFVKEKS